MSQMRTCPSCKAEQAAGPATCATCGASMKGAVAAYPPDSRARVVVTDVQIEFFSMMSLILKFVLASIPAMLLLAILSAVAVGFFTAVGIALGGAYGR